MSLLFRFESFAYGPIIGAVAVACKGERDTLRQSAAEMLARAFTIGMNGSNKKMKTNGNE